MEADDLAAVLGASQDEIKAAVLHPFSNEHFSAAFNATEDELMDYRLAGDVLARAGISVAQLIKERPTPQPLPSNAQPPEPDADEIIRGADATAKRLGYVRNENGNFVKPGRVPYRERHFVRGLNTRHLAVLKWTLENPTCTQKQCAQAIGLSENSISRIVNSPEFRAKRQQIMDEELRAAAYRLSTRRPGDK